MAVNGHLTPRIWQLKMDTWKRYSGSEQMAVSGPIWPLIGQLGMDTWKRYSGAEQIAVNGHLIPLIIAAENGHLATLQWIRANGGCDWPCRAALAT